MSLRRRNAIAPLLFRCRSATVAPDVATQSHRYCTAIASLSLRRCSSCCSYADAPAIASAVAPLLLHCRSDVSLMSLRCCSAVSLLSLRYHSDVALLLLCCHLCRSVSAAVATAIATFSLLLLLLLSPTVVTSRGRIWVTVFIGDFQARVFFSSEGCSTSQKTVKVEYY